MKRLFLTALLAMVPVQAALAQPEDAFTACVNKTGAEYQKARDAYLKTPSKPEFLREKVKSKVFAERLTARILLGWQEHADEYRKLLDTPKIVLQTGKQVYPWSRDRSGISAAAVPLMYELLMKDTQRGAAQDAARALINLVVKEPKTPLDVVLLHRYLREQAKADADSRQATAWVLGELPANYQAPKELLATLEKEVAEKGKEQATVLPLLDGLAIVAGTMEGEDRDAIVTRLQELKPLEGMLGKTRMTYALASVGGERAGRVVADYLEAAPDAGEKQWALRALAKSDSVIGTETVLKYTESDQEALRETAIAELDRVRYTEAVGERLEEIAMSGNLPRLQQREAIYSLAKISAKHRDEGVKGQIHSRLQKISASSKDKKLQAELDEIIRSLEENK